MIIATLRPSPIAVSAIPVSASRLIRPGQTYYLTIEGTVLCADCALVEGVIRVREDLVVQIKRDRLLIQRGEAEVEVFPSEIRHLVNALAEAAARLVDSREVNE